MKLLKGLWIGFWSGLILGLLMKWMQQVTGVRIYELLLNVDFIPLVNEVNWSELTEFVFHLIISLIIGIVYVYIAKRRSYTFGQLTIISLILTLPTYLLFFPLSMLAVEADVPEPGDMGAFLYWILAHLTYALLLPILYKTFERENAASH